MARLTVETALVIVEQLDPDPGKDPVGRGLERQWPQAIIRAAQAVQGDKAEEDRLTDALAALTGIAFVVSLDKTEAAKAHREAGSR